MSGHVSLTWRAARDPLNGRPDPNQGQGFDGTLMIGVVQRASNDPQNRGAWRWSMFAYGRLARMPQSLKRTVAAHSKEQAKADCEAAYRELLAAHPGNREEIHAHHEALQERLRLYASGEGLARSMETTSKRIKQDQETVAAAIAMSKRCNEKWPA